MTREKILLYIVRASLFASLLAPLIIGPTFVFPFVVPKTIFFRVFVEIAGAFLIPLLIISKKYRPKLNYMFWSVIAVSVIYTIATFTGVDVYRSLWSTFERMGGLYTFLHLTLFYIIASSVMKEKSDWYWLFRVSIGVALYISFYGIAQKFGSESVVETGVARVGSTIGNSIFLASYLMANIFFAFMMLMDKVEHIGWKYYNAFSLLVFLLVTYFAGSRGVFLGLFAGFVIFILLYIFFGENVRLKKAFSIGIISVIALVGLIFAMKDTAFVKRDYTLYRMTHTTYEDVRPRFIAWEIAYNGWKDKFWLGWGPENYNVVYNLHYDPLVMEGVNSEVWFDRAHNIIFDWATTTGVIGLAGYLVGFLLLPLWLLWQALRQKKIQLALIAVPMGFLIGNFAQNFFVFDMINTYITFFAFLAYISFVSDKTSDENNEIITKVEQKNNRKNQFNQKKIFWPLTTSLLIMLLFQVNLNYRSLQSAYWVGQAISVTFSSQDNLSVSASNSMINLFNKALSFSRFGNKEAVMRLVNLAVRITESSNVSTADKLNFVKYALEQAKISTEQNPLDVRTWLDLGRLEGRFSYIDLANRDTHLNNAKDSLQNSLKLSPRRQAVFYELSSIFLISGDLQESVKYAKQAVDLNPKVPESHWNLAIIYNQMKDYVNAEKEIDASIANGYNYRRSKNNMSLIVDVYLQQKATDKLIPVLQTLISIDQMETRWYFELAKIYYQNGDKNKAIETVNMLLNVSDGYKGVVEDFIKTLK